jgi:hypothetical protein
VIATLADIAVTKVLLRAISNLLKKTLLFAKKYSLNTISSKIILFG